MIKNHLSYKILISIILGILLGSILHTKIEYRDIIITNILSPTGDIFINMIKMIVLPMIIFTLIVGIGSVDNIKTLGKIGIKTIIYFEIITFIAIILGIIVANIFHPGYDIDLSMLYNSEMKYEENKLSYNIYNKISYNNILNIISSIIPLNIIASISKGELLPIIFFSIFFGIGISSLPKSTKKPLLEVFNAISATIFNMTNIIMLYAPIGIFSIISITISKFGLLSILPLVKLIIIIYCAMIFFTLFILGTIARIFSFRILKIIKILKEEIILAFSTASSESVLQKLIEKMEAYGSPSYISSFVISTGYSFNLDGSSLYQSISAIFITQLYGIHLSIEQEILLAFTLMITSKGVAGVPGVSFIVLLSTLNSLGFPLKGIVFISGVDRILDMARTALNVIGNAVAVIVIAKLENKYDNNKAMLYEKKYFINK